MSTITPRPYGALPAFGFVRQKDLIPSIIPWSPSTLWRMVRAGKFPQPFKLSRRVTAWRVDDVRAWLASPDLAFGDSSIARDPGSTTSDERLGGRAEVA